MRPLRVAVVGRSVYALHGFGGLERHLYDLVRHHLAEGWEVTLITRTAKRPSGVLPDRWVPVATHPRFTLRSVPYRSFPLAGRRGTTILDRSTAYPLFGLRAGRVAAGLATQNRVDIVYGVGASLLGYARAHRLRNGPRAPLVLNPQGLEEFGGFDGSYGGRRLKAVGYGPLRGAVRIVSRAADAVIATDRSLEPMVRAHLRESGTRLRLIPNGLDVAAAEPLVRPDAGAALRRQYGIADHEVLFVSVGRLEANKGFADLIEALATIAGDVSWRWTLVGDGPERQPLVAAAAARGLGERVIYAGASDDERLHAWYDAADLFVHPTRYEGSSLVTLEAMLHRKPVVATRAGGLPDKVVPGTTGWLVEPRNPHALGSALNEALRSRPAWRSYGDAGRALLEREFDWKVIQTKFRELYEDLLGIGRGTRDAGRAGP
jgi:glycosyltransferase involved in cell wall biosynthesis